MYFDEPINANDLPQRVAFDPIPEGWYTATATGAEIKRAKAGSGQYLNVKWAITGPTHESRSVFGRITLRNENTTAVEIGRQHLRELMDAAGLTSLTNTDQLIGVSISIKVSVSPARGDFEASNDVKGYKAMAGGPPHTTTAPPRAAPTHQPQQPQAAGTQTAPAHRNAPPWARPA